MSNKPRRRLDVQERRRQLLLVGSELFASRPYDDVWVDDVAARAGVSRGLLYHYFGSKRGFLHAVVEHETEQILAATEPIPGAPAADRLRDSIDGYLDYVVAHPHGYRAIFRGVISADARVRELVEANLRRQEERILTAVSPDRAATAHLRLAVHGWLAFLVAIVLDWLDTPTVERDDLADLGARALDALLAIAAAASGPGDDG